MKKPVSSFSNHGVNVMILCESVPPPFFLFFSLPRLCFVPFRQKTL